MPQFTVTTDSGTYQINAKDQASAMGNAPGGNARIGGAPSAPQPAQQSAPQPAPTASVTSPSSTPPPAPPPAGFPDTNTYAGRQQLRDQGYYVDPTGIYAPGAGQRVGDTFSGSMASQNVAPSPTQLPILNGNPVSPSNGFTGPQTPYIMYRGDPLYPTYFGAGTPGYTSTSQTYNAVPGPLPTGQATFESTFGTARTTPQPLPDTSSDTFNTTMQPAGAPAGFTQSGIPEGTNRAVTPTPQQIAESTAAPTATTDNQAQFLAGIQAPNQSGNGYGPYATSEVPQLTVQGTYTDNGRTIQKSVDQFGNPYYQDVGAAASAPGAPAAPGSAASPTAAPAAAPAGPQTGTQQAPAQQPLTAIASPDGQVFQVPVNQARAIQDYFARIAQQQAQTLQFNQGLDQQKFDLQKMVDQADIAYKQGLLKYQNDQLAQQAAYQAMQIEVQRQAQELQRSAQAQQFTLAAQTAQNDRANQANQLALERERLQVQRQQMRTGRRVAVRFA